MNLTVIKETDSLKQSRGVLNDNFTAIKSAIETILSTEEGIKAVTDALAKVATSGKYSDLSGRPSSLPASDVSAWAKAASKPSYSWTEISGRPSSLPASDVYAWAKASSKPGYSWSEISGKPSSMPANGGTSTSVSGGTASVTTLTVSGTCNIPGGKIWIA